LSFAKLTYTLPGHVCRRFCDQKTKTGVDAFKIVAQLTSRHFPVDSRYQIEETPLLADNEVWDPHAVSRDMWGENQVAMLANILKSTGLEFEDPTFPAHSSSLYISAQR